MLSEVLRVVAVMRPRAPESIISFACIVLLGQVIVPWIYRIKLKAPNSNEHTFWTLGVSLI